MSTPGPATAHAIATLYNEDTTVEREILEHLRGPALGWRYETAKQVVEHYRMAADRSVDEREVLLIPLLRQQLQALNPGVITDDERAERIITRLRAVQSNQEWMRWLRNEQTYQFAPDELYQTIRLIDFETIDNNDFLATNQFRIEGQAPCRPDILLFVNGVPVVDIEAKTASRGMVDWAEGATQTRRYSEEIPQLMHSNAFCIGVNETRMKYGAPEARLQHWQQWRDATPHEIDAFDEMKVSLYGMLDRANLLDVIRYFILFCQEHGKTIKKIARYQQYRAANKIVNRAVKVSQATDQRRGLVWHTQGSGKTLTMIFVARKLWDHPDLNQPTIVMLVDREQLEGQMSRELFATDTGNWSVAGSIRDLRAKLAGDYRGVILTTVHKFDGMLAGVTDRPNVIILADEAHRTQEGDYGIYMRAALPEATIFGLTGTPIENNDHDTPRQFGRALPDGKFERYMDSYTVADSLRDKATVPIHFEPRLIDWQLWGAELDTTFNRAFADLEETERARLTSREARLDALMTHPQRLSQVVGDVVRHFKEKVRPNGFKAMLVCRNKEMCHLYKEALDRLLEPSASLVVISEAPGSDSPAIRAHYLGEKGHKDAIDKFTYPVPEETARLEGRQRYRNVEILIVCDMLLTGFDAPICQTMYLDKGLKDHGLLQAIARVNRPYTELKKHGQIVDYYGVFDNLNDALNYDPAEIGDVAFPYAHLQQRFIEEFDVLMALFADIEKDGSHTSYMQAMVFFNENPEARTQFEKGYRNVRILYEALQPDAFLREYIRPYAWLTKLYMLYRKKFDPKSHFELTAADGAKTRELIRDHINVEEMKRDFPTYVLDADFLTKVRDETPDAKALDIEAALSAELRIRLDEDEEFQALSERLQKIIDEKRAGTLAGIALIRELEDLAKIVVEAVKERKRPIAHSIAQAVCDRVDDISNEQAVEVAQAVVAKADALCFPGWYLNEAMDTELYRAFTVVLADEYPDLRLIGPDKDFVARCIKLLKRRHYRGSDHVG